MSKNKQVFFEDWGLIDYQQAWEKQESIFASTVKLKTELRNRGEDDASFIGIKTVTPNYLIFCEHLHVYTLGKSGKKEHLLLTENQLKEKHAQFLHFDCRLFAIISNWSRFQEGVIFWVGKSYYYFGRAFVYKKYLTYLYFVPL